MGRAGSAPAGGGRLTARWLAVDGQQMPGPGEIAWDRDGRIVQVRRARGPVADVCVVPAMVDAHVHLQLPALAKDHIAFVPWLQAVMAERGGRDAAAERACVRDALAELRADGVAAVGEIDSSGASWQELARHRMGGRCYRELTGFHLDAAGARELVRARMPRANGGACAVGLSPHAPYSVSPALFAAAAARARHLAIHCAEVPEEQRFLHSGTGPFADLLASLGRLPAGFRPPRRGAVRWLADLGVLRPNTQLVHCQELERGDVARIAAAGASIVVCPGTIEYFGRQPPPVARWLRAGIPVALGTDSRASNRGLSMRAELQRAARLWPQLAPRQLFDMATRAGARSLGLPRLARLRRGDRADLLVLPAPRGFDAALATFVHGGPPDAIVHAGRFVRAGDRRHAIADSAT